LFDKAGVSEVTHVKNNHPRQQQPQQPTHPTD
jgi:hypothetical protein